MSSELCNSHILSKIKSIFYDKPDRSLRCANIGIRNTTIKRYKLGDVLKHTAQLVI